MASDKVGLKLAQPAWQVIQLHTHYNCIHENTPVPHVLLTTAKGPPKYVSLDNNTKGVAFLISQVLLSLLAS